MADDAPTNEQDQSNPYSSSLVRPQAEPEANENNKGVKTKNLLNSANCTKAVEAEGAEKPEDEDQYHVFPRRKRSCFRCQKRKQQDHKDQDSIIEEHLTSRVSAIGITETSVVEIS